MRTFLTAEWRHLLMLNYAIEPELLRAYVPKGVELDDWNGTTYISMVGFMFLRTRLFGLPVPWHSDFEEVNLRFYVRRKTSEGWRRGVVFIREIVPRQAIAAIARLCYNEPYRAMPMRHRIDLENGKLSAGGVVEYGWKHQNHWQFLRANATGVPSPIATGSVEEFITEHYWGYTMQRDGGCIEYNVEHPRWKVWQVNQPVFECNVASLYGGPEFVAPLGHIPSSAFIAEGSLVTVRVGKKF